MSDGDSKFDTGAVRDFASLADIQCKITSAYNPRGNAKVERMVGTLKRAIQKVAASKMDEN